MYLYLDSTYSGNNRPNLGTINAQHYMNKEKVQNLNKFGDTQLWSSSQLASLPLPRKSARKKPGCKSRQLQQITFLGVIDSNPVSIQHFYFFSLLFSSLFGCSDSFSCYESALIPLYDAFVLLGYDHTDLSFSSCHAFPSPSVYTSMYFSAPLLFIRFSSPFIMFLGDYIAPIFAFVISFSLLYLQDAITNIGVCFGMAMFSSHYNMLACGTPIRVPSVQNSL